MYRWLNVINLGQIFIAMYICDMLIHNMHTHTHKHTHFFIHVLIYVIIRAHSFIHVYINQHILVEHSVHRVT